MIYDHVILNDMTTTVIALFASINALVWFAIALSMNPMGR